MALSKVREIDAVNVNRVLPNDILVNATAGNKYKQV